MERSLGELKDQRQNSFLNAPTDRKGFRLPLSKTKLLFNAGAREKGISSWSRAARAFRSRALPRRDDPRMREHVASTVKRLNLNGLLGWDVDLGLEPVGARAADRLQ